MAETTEREKLLAYLKKVSADLFDARERLRKLEAGEQEPVAIIGMGCRFPGGIQDPDGLWDLVATGTDAISGFPENRGWEIEPPADPAVSFARSGGFIADIAGFDAGFFGISPREALATDPQQRLLLEISWEALERAGLDPRSLHGSRTGVFVGGAFSGYTAGMTGAESEGYLMTGGLTAVMSGRVSYALGLEGPAVTLDTACSSSLVALHLACQSLRSGESTLALAGGVSLLVIPVVYAEFSKQQGMAADGRCKAFAGAADGIGWAEGAGMVALEKLSDARRNRHRVLAVIAGSAANQDGASNGLTAPNGPSQRRVIRAALASARLSADQVDAVEGHGTGTTLGDPIEAQALLATYGQGRPAGRPLWLGSVKSNIGHSQSAAGVAGVMKMVLALEHGVLPRTLHVDEPSPHVDWSDGDIALLTEPVPWPADADRPRRAGVSAFGASGTNVHLILEEPPAPDDATHADAARDAAVPVLTGGPAAWLLSGRSAAALAGQAARLAGWVAARPGLAPAGLAWSLATTRPAFEHRAVVIGRDRAALAAGTAAVAAGRPSPAVIAGIIPAGGDPGTVVFVFPGQGGQWAGMGTELAAASPVFASKLAECSRALAPYTGWPLTDVLADPARLDRVDVVQPALWAVMVSLAAVWEAAGVRPDVVVGHSQGEIAAAVVAGILSLDDAAKVVALRSKALTALAGRGGMASVALGAEAVRRRLTAAGQVRVAAVNGPSATVVSGDSDALAELVAECEEAGIRARVLPVDYASHGPQIDELEREITAALAGLEPRRGRLPMLSAMTGEYLDGPEADAAYWYASLRAPVEFERSIATLAGDGHKAFIEVSPHPVLTSPIADTLEHAGVAGVVAGTLRRDDGGPARLLAALAQAHAHGVPVDWTAVLPAAPAVELPTYAFQHQRYWVDPINLTGAGPAAAGGDGATAVAEARFWSAVEDGDASELARVLALDAGTALDGLLPALAAWRQRERAGAAVADWRYRVAWAPVPDLAPVALPGSWLLVTPAGHARLAGQVATALTARGAAVRPIEIQTADPERTGPTPRATGSLAGGAGREAIAALIGDALAGGVRPAGVVSLLALDEAPLPGAAAVPAGLAGTLGLIQALGDAGIDAPLWLLTRGAVAALPGEVPGSAVQAQAWGLGRTAGVEHPGRWGGLVDLPPIFGERAAAALGAILAGCGEQELAIRPAGVFARRLVRAPRPVAAGQWRPRGTVLVTGASGSIGPDLAQWLAESGAPRVVLMGRRGPQTPGAAALAAELAAAGTEVGIAACDVTDRRQAACLLAWAGAGGPPVSSVIHAAVAVDLEPVADTTVTSLARALGAKAAGAALLDELTAGTGVTDFILFSSIAATWGVSEHAAYAAANAYLDALAQQRRARGLPATSVAWGVWSSGGKFDETGLNETGLNEAGATVAGRPQSLVPQRLARQGLCLLDPAQALSALSQVLAAGETVTAVADVDWARFAPVFTAARPWRLFDEIPEARQAMTAGTATAAVTTTELAVELSGLGPPDRERVVTALVRTHAAAALGFTDEGAVAAGRAFRDMGFDSLTAIELRNRLNAATGLTLPSTVVFDYPSPALLAREVVTRLVGIFGGSVAAPPAGARAAAPGEPVAIVGMGCRFPGGVDTPEALWELLVSGGDAVGSFPPDRGWDMAGLLDPDPDRPGTSYASEGGFVSGIGDFDPAFFGISPREALAMDPQQRLLLETAWEALERAGIDPVGLRGSATGVFAGAAASGYAAQAMGVPGVEGHLITGNVTSVISGRISYALGLEGPALTVDTACSSALVALHLACAALRAGECSLALAGGVMVIADPAEFVGFSRQRALAADGRCKAFADSADGMGLAEGAGMIALERLSDARRNGHRVLAVVSGSAVNSDGASNGLTAPNGPSQQRVIAAALASARLSPADIDAVEGHGTGTTLGDPIEAQALIAAYGQDRPADRPLWLGSVKSNIGHAQQAAGAAAVIKMALALQHGVLPRTLHVDEPTTHVDWRAGQVRLLTEPVPWPAAGGRVRRAGISAFGISGTNAHIILEEPPVAVEETHPEPITEEGGPQPEAGRAEAGRADPPAAPRVLAADAGVFAWPVSGTSAVALAAQAGKLAGFVTDRPRLEPSAVAWSLTATRSAFEHRAVVVGAGRDELAAGLAALAARQPSVNVVSGSMPPGGDPGKVVFVFPGQGGQWAGMGTELAATSAVFAAQLAACARALEPFTGWRLEDVLADADGAPGLDRVDVVQPALWAVLVSLAAVWRAAGVEPDAVAGHSQGEIAAAVVAGILSLEDAAKVVALRSRALMALAGRGGMASLGLPAAAVRARLAAGVRGQRAAAGAGWAERVQVAAVNGPDATVVSGDQNAIAELVAVCAADGIRARVLPVDYASHGPQVTELEQEITSALAGIVPRPARIPMISAMTGEFLAGPEADAGYWYASLRAPVEFYRSVQVLAGTGHRVFIEASPRPVLTAPITAALEEAGADGTVSGTLRRDDGGPGRLLASLAAAAVRGVAVDWARVLPAAPPVELPTYAFQRQRYWPSAPGLVAVAAGGDGAGTAAEARFWAAVEDGDLAELADALEVDGRRPFSEVLPALSTWRKRERAASAVESWRYRIAWAAVADSGPAAFEGSWLLVAQAGRADEDIAGCADALAARGAQVITVPVGPGDADRQALGGLIARSARLADGAAATPIAGVLSLLALDETPLPGLAEVPGGLAATVALVQALGDAGIEAPLWAVTRGAVAAAPGEAVSSPVQAHCWGLGRVVALEHPARWGGLIDLPAVLEEKTVGWLCSVLAHRDGEQGEDQVAVRSSGLFARRLIRADRPNPTKAWAPSGTALITGGTGSIGGHVARWLAHRGTPRAVLAARSGPAAPGAAALAADLAAAGTAVTVVACDTARRTDLAGLLNRIAADGPPLTAVFHAAGSAPGLPVDDSTAAGLAGVLGVKAAGAAWLDELTAGLDLEAFVLFSSGSATWGSANLAGYAAANAYLDALAEQRRARGRSGTSIAWGLWAGGGMGDGEAGLQLQRLGVRDMNPELAISALAQALDGGETTLTVADVDWSRFAPVFTLRRPSPLLGALPEAAQALRSAAEVAPRPDQDGSDLVKRLADLPRAGQERLLTDLVRAEAAAVLGFGSPESVEPARAFKELGFDSVTALELRNRLRAATGLALPATVIYDHPSSAALAASLRSALVAGDETDAPPVLADIGRLESVLRNMPENSEIRDDITRALRGILSHWIETQHVSDPDSPTSEADIAFESATPDQVFDFLDKELGTAGSL